MKDSEKIKISKEFKFEIERAFYLGFRVKYLRSSCKEFPKRKFLINVYNKEIAFSHFCYNQIEACSFLNGINQSYNYLNLLCMINNGGNRGD